MIVQSPESAMPEPYKTYVRQRSDAISSVLEEVVGGVDVQLCPRAILPQEQIFNSDNSHVYGVVVREHSHGYKSALYTPEFNEPGLATNDFGLALRYAQEQFELANRVRVKDPRESDGRGQYTVESIDELGVVFDDISADSEYGCVLMPHLNDITQRISVGRIILKGLGDFSYIGRENLTSHEGTEVYGGTMLGLFHSAEKGSKGQVEETLGISSSLTSYGEAALDAYSKIALFCGRVSVDVIEGRTDNGSLVRSVVDVTPRVGGTTPAEVLAIREIYLDTKALCFATSELIYDPLVSPDTGVNFVDTDTLVINAQIQEVRK